MTPDVVAYGTEEQWHALFLGSPIGIALIDEAGAFVAANPALCTLLCRSEEDLRGRSWTRFSHPLDRMDHAELDAGLAAAPGGVVRAERRYLRPDGVDRWLRLTVTHVPGPAGRPWILAHVEDVTERRTAEQARARTQANLTAVATVVKRIQSGADARQAVVDACADLAGASFVSLAQPDADGTVLRVTASTAGGLVGTAAATGVPSATVTVFRTGLPHFSASAARDPAIAPSLLALTGARSVYLLPVCAAGSTIGVLIVAWSRKVPDTQDPRASVVTLLVDHAGVAIRQAALTAELADMALADALTGLPNRRSWDGRAAVALAAARRSGRPLVVALADVDRFKDFNDVHGHAAGDAVLRHFAAAARAVVREVDTVARWGGEEFAFALPDCGARQAAVVLDRVRQATRTEGVTCSIGFAEWDGVEDEAGLMARCDRALYAAKRAGRDRVVADPDGPRAPAG